MTEGEDVGGAVIQAIVADQQDAHANEAVVTVESNDPQPVIFVPSHCPGSKEVTRTKDCLWGDNCFNGVCRKVT